MLGINFSEWLLIAVVAFVVIGPKELPVVVRHIASFVREIRTLLAGFKAQMHDVAREAGWDDIMQDVHEMRHTTTIIDLEGKPQQAYNVRELQSLENNPPAPSSSGLSRGSILGAQDGAPLDSRNKPENDEVFSMPDKK